MGYIYVDTTILKNILSFDNIKKEIENLKIIDVKLKNNIVYFYLGQKNVMDYKGDDWDDTPYELNAETVYDEYVEKILVAYYFENIVILEPCSNIYNGAEYTKLQMKKRLIPCCGISEPTDGQSWEYETMFNTLAENEKSVAFFFEDEAIKIIESIIKPYCIQIIDSKNSI